MTTGCLPRGPRCSNRSSRRSLRRRPAERGADIGHRKIGKRLAHPAAQAHNARRLYDTGQLRPGITIARAADVLWTYSAPELYELMVLRRGWSRKRYGRFVADAMIAALL